MYQKICGSKGGGIGEMKCCLSCHYLTSLCFLDSNHGTQMLRVSDIFPQAVSGSLAAFVGSCVGSLGAASGSVPWLCL